MALFQDKTCFCIYLERLSRLLQLCWQESHFQRLNCIKHSYIVALWQVRGESRRRRSLRSALSIPQGSITLPSSLTQNLSLEQQQQASRVHFNFFQTSAVFQVCSLKNNIPNHHPLLKREAWVPHFKSWSSLFTTLQDKNMGKRRLNSGILGASVANLSITRLRDDVIIRLRNTEAIPVNLSLK